MIHEMQLPFSPPLFTPYVHMLFHSHMLYPPEKKEGMKLANLCPIIHLHCPIFIFLFDLNLLLNHQCHRSFTSSASWFSRREKEAEKERERGTVYVTSFTMFKLVSNYKVDLNCFTLEWFSFFSSQPARNLLLSVPVRNRLVFFRAICAIE